MPRQSTVMYGIYINFFIIFLVTMLHLGISENNQLVSIKISYVNYLFVSMLTTVKPCAIFHQVRISNKTNKLSPLRMLRKSDLVSIIDFILFV